MFLRVTIVTLILLLASVLSYVYFSTPTSQNLSLRLIHINDLHGHIVPSTMGGRMIDIARTQSLIHELSSDNPNVVTLAVGDHIYGSPETYLFSQSEVWNLLNELTIDFISLGNHEFDLGEDNLVAFITNAKSQVLSGNVSSNDLALRRVLQPFVLSEIDGQTVAILAVLPADTPALSNVSDGTEFEAAIPFLTREISTLKEAGVNIFILMSHLGYEEDIGLAKRIPDIDVIVGGHSNTYLSNRDSSAEGPYPTVVNDTYIVQTLPAGSAVGTLDLVIDEHGNVVDGSGDSYLIQEETPRDSTLAHMVDELVSKIPVTQLGTTTNQLNGSYNDCNRKPCGVGNLIIAALVSETTNDNVDYIVVNSGAIRDSLPQGKVTWFDLLKAIPFRDTYVIATVDGSELLNILNDEEQFQSGTQVGCIECSEVGTCTIDPEMEYQIAANSFLLRNFDRQIIRQSTTTIQEVVARELSSTNPYEVENDNQEIFRCAIH